MSLRITQTIKAIIKCKFAISNIITKSFSPYMDKILNQIPNNQMNLLFKKKGNKAFFNKILAKFLF